MLEWLVLLAGTLLFIINLAEREHVTNPPASGQEDATIVLSKEAQAKLDTYKRLLTASTLNPNDAAAAQATAAAKTQVDSMLAEEQQGTVNLQEDIQRQISGGSGLGGDVVKLREQVASYTTTLPTLKDTLNKSEVNTADRVQNTSILIAKAVAICVIGVFAVFVGGVY
jgi:phage repressor protein C with HTH and peptisase S24 domain